MCISTVSIIAAATVHLALLGFLLTLKYAPEIWLSAAILPWLRGGMYLAVVAVVGGFTGMVLGFAALPPANKRRVVQAAAQKR